MRNLTSSRTTAHSRRLSGPAHGRLARWVATLAACWITVPCAQPAPGDSELETIQIRPNVYVIFGAGGNHALASTGIPIAGAPFGSAPTAGVLAHENVLLRMADEGVLPYEDWPTETYTSKVRSMYINDDGIVVMRRIGAHSDGDSMVHFRRADVIATGDILDLRHFPAIDPAKGGSIQGELAALNHLLEITIPAMPLVLKPGRTLLVPGHGYISDYAELVEYQNMVTIIHDRIKDLIDKDMSLEDIKAADPAQGYRGRYGSDSGPWTTEMFVEAVYQGLTNPPTEQ